MKEQRIVALFGDSLLMDAVEASLSSRQELGVMRLDTPISDEVCLRSLNPDLAIFDLDTPPGFIVRFIRNHPGVPLLGLDVTNNQVIVISSQQHTPLTMDDLAQMIRLQTSHSHFRSLSYRAREKKIGYDGMFSTLGIEILQ